MSDKGGAYEHRSDVTGFGSADGPAAGEEHMEGSDAAGVGRLGGRAGQPNEIDMEGRSRGLPDPDEIRQPGRTQPHGPETHQDTRIAEKDGA
jgi:hypothetical protein